MDAAEVGKRVNYFRTRRGLSKNALANNAGVSPTYIYKVEKGLVCPTVEYLGHLCWGLGITYMEFFTLGEDKPNDRLTKLTSEQRALLNNFLNSL